MGRVRSNNKKSDRSKIHLFRGKIPSDRVVDQKTDHEQSLIIDEVKSSATQKMRIVITWLPKDSRSRFRKTASRFPKNKKGEVKYSNTGIAEQVDIYEDLITQDFEIYDSFSIHIPNTVIADVWNMTEHKLGYWESVYLYELEMTIRSALADHKGKIDMILDYPPFDITDELMSMCTRLIGEGFGIQWFTITPSSQLSELQVHDFIAGVDYDLVAGEQHLGGRSREPTASELKRYEIATESLRKKKKN